MANDYFTPTELSRHTLGRAEQVNQSFTAVEAGFDKLPTPEAIKQGRITYLVDSGVVNAYVVAFSPALSSYTAGTRVLMNTANANTGSATLNAGAGAVSIKRFDGSALQAGDIPNGIADLVYTGSEWRLINTHNAAASVTAAATSATAAANSASAASTSETNAAASYDAFDDRYLGSKASDPALDNDGDALLTGALYWNTTDGILKIYTGSAWQNLLRASQIILFSAEYDNGNSGAAKTIDWNNGNKQKLTLTDNVTLTFTAPDPTGVGHFQLKLIQDATGSRTVAWPTIKTSGGVFPSIASAAAAETIISIYYDGTNYYVSGIANWSTAS